MIKILDNPNELLKEMELNELKQEHDKHVDIIQEILNSCGIKKEVLNFVDLGRDMFKDNQVILNKYFRNEAGQDCYYANLLALRGMEKIEDIKKVLKHDFKQEVSLAGYRYDPEHYRFVTQGMQDEYEEDLFKSNRDEKLEFEADRRKRIEPLDFEAVKSLYEVLFKALRQRYIMLFNLETVPGILNNALECYCLGVSCGPSNAAMNAKIAELRQLLENKEVIAWLKTGVTDMSFDREDYVTTYQKVLRQLTDIRVSQEDINDEVFDLEREAKYWLSQVVEAPSTELDIAMAYQDEADGLALTSPRNQWYDLIHNDEDIYEEEIIANDCPDFEKYTENDSDDEDDYLENNEIFD